MKKKYLKKMLAIMLASMTVAATPGLVGAMKGESRKAIEDANSKIANNELTIEEATNMLDDLEEMANEDDEAKKEVAKTIKNGFLNYLFRKESLGKIVNILTTCSQSKESETKSNVATAIEEMISRLEWELQPGEYELFARILNVLEICTQDPAAMPNVAKAISRMNHNNFWDFGDDTRVKILNILETCATNSAAARSRVALTIDTMFYINDQSLNIFLNESLDRVIDILEICAQEPTAIEYVISAVRRMNGSLTNGYNLTNILHRVLGILDICSKNDDAAEEAALAISWLCWMINEESMDETLMDAFKKFSEKTRPAFYISRAISAMGERGTLNQCAPHKTQQIIDIFLKCPRRYDSFGLAYDAIPLIKRNVLQRCRPDQIQKLSAELIKMLKKHGQGIHPIYHKNTTEAINEMIKKDLLSESNIDTIISFAKEPTCWDDTDNAISIIKTIVENDSIVRKTPDRISKTIDALAKILEGNFGPECMAIPIVTTMSNRDMLNQCDDSQIQKIVDSLIRFLQAGHTEDIAADAVSAMSEKGLLNKFKPDQIRQIAGNLTRLLENNDTREAATIIISAMAEDPATFNQFNNDQLQQILSLFKTHLGNYLANGNYEMVDRIFKVCKKCSEVNYLKADVADITKALVYENNFRSYINQDVSATRLGDFLDISVSCSKNPDANARGKAMHAITWLNRQVDIGVTQNAANKIEQKIPQIIEALAELSTVDQAKVYVSDSIRLLGKRNFLNNLEDTQKGRLITALKNCLTYGGQLIPSSPRIGSDQCSIAYNIHNIFYSSTWMASFRAGLLPEDASRLKEVDDGVLTVMEVVSADPYSKN